MSSPPINRDINLAATSRTAAAMAGAARAAAAQAADEARRTISLTRSRPYLAAPARSSATPRAPMERTVSPPQSRSRYCGSAVRYSSQASSQASSRSPSSDAGSRQSDGSLRLYERSVATEIYDRIRSRATNVQELLDLRETDVNMMNNIDNDLDIWANYLTSYDIRTAFTENWRPAAGSRMTVEEVNLFILRMAIRAREHYLEDHQPNQIGEPDVAGFTLIDGFVNNDAEYSFNDFDLPTFQDTFKNKVDYLFVEKGLINSISSRGYTALWWSSTGLLNRPSEANVGRVQYLLLNRADPNIFNTDALGTSKSALGEFLIKLSFFPLFQNPDLVKRARYVKVVKMFIEKGAIFHDLDYAFNLLVLNNINVDVIAFLIDSGIALNKKALLRNVNGGSNQNTTPLFAACYSGSLQNINLLYSKGARMTEDEKNDIFLTIFRGEGHEVGWNAVIGDNTITSLSPQVLNERLQLIRAVVKVGGRLDGVEVQHDKVGIITTIINKYNIDSNNAIDAILLVAKENGIDTVALLNQRDKENWTALGYMLEKYLAYLEEENANIYMFEVVKHLLELGADVDVVNQPLYDGRTLYEGIRDFDDERYEEDYDLPRKEAEQLLDLLDEYISLKRIQEAEKELKRKQNIRPVLSRTPQPTPDILTVPQDLPRPNPLQPAAAADTGKRATTYTNSRPSYASLKSTTTRPTTETSLRPTTTDTGLRPVAVVNSGARPITSASNTSTRQTTSVSVNNAREVRTPESIIRGYMAAANLHISSTGPITADILRTIANAVGIRGWTTLNGIEAKRAFIASELTKKGY